MAAALLLFFHLHVAQAQERLAYDCQYVNGDSGSVQLEDEFSTIENMHLGSVVINNPNQTTVRWSTRNYQFLMPDNQRYIQIWYLSSDFHVDGQFQVVGTNDVFAATIKNMDRQLPLLCRKK